MKYSAHFRLIDLSPQRAEVTHDGWTAFGHNLQTQTPHRILPHNPFSMCCH